MQSSFDNLFDFVQETSEQVFMSGWGKSLPVRFENRQWERPSTPWAQLSIGWAGSRIIVADGIRYKEHSGQVVIEVYAQVGGSRDDALLMTGRAKSAFATRSFRDGRFAVVFGIFEAAKLDVRWGKCWCAAISCPFASLEMLTGSQDEYLPNESCSA